MADILEYLAWRGDVPFEVDPFNEVDDLILSMLSYLRMSGAVPAAWEGGSVTLKEARDAYYALHGDEEIKEDGPISRRIPALLDAAADAPRYANIRAGRFIDLLCTHEEEQLAVVTFELDDGSLYVAFRGTDGTLVGWKEDFNLSFMKETSGQKDAVRYMNRCFSGGTEKIRVGGHSKGGNLAVYASAFCEPEIRDRIISIYSYDGPGFREEITSREEFAAIRHKIVKVIPESSIIGILLGGDTERELVDSSASGIQQHNALTWQVFRNRFVRVESRTPVSEYFEDVLGRWIAELDDDSRKSFVDSLYKMLTSGGSDTLADLTEDGWKTVQDVVKGLSSMPSEERKEFTGVLGSLLKKGGEGISDLINNGIWAPLGRIIADAGAAVLPPSEEERSGVQPAEAEKKTEGEDAAEDTAAPAQEDGMSREPSPAPLDDHAEASS